MSKDLQQWPPDQLETVNTCPVCGSAAGTPLESGLTDWMSNPPTGLWNLVSCLDCGVAWLSPRPVPESIGKAYANYHTHTSDKDDLVDSRLRRLRNLLAEKYYAVANGSGSVTDHFLYFSIRAIFPVASYLDAKSRHIFELENRPGKLLDIGCGNGEFLRFARKYGWDVVGVDFDHIAVAEACSGGLDVRTGSLEVIRKDEKFDFISLSHVIEHVYHPAAFIQSCFSLLREDGRLWLETPNIEGKGYQTYTSNWRGLEPPRHLVLFRQEALRKILLGSGFTSVDQKSHGLAGLYMGLTSERILDKVSPPGSAVSSIRRKLLGYLRVARVEIVQLLSKRRREFVTLIAVRK